MRPTTQGVVVLVLAAGIVGSLRAQPPGGGGRGKTLTAPTGITVTSTRTALTVSWNNVRNATSYTVHREEGGSIVNLVSGHPGTPYTGTLPTAGVAYKYQVVALQWANGVMTSAGSVWVTYTAPTLATPGTGIVVTEPRPGTGGTITPIVIPAGPSELRAESTIPGQINISWTAVANAVNYRVMRSSNAPEPETKLGEATTLAFLHAPADERWLHTYRVVAVFGNGTTSASSPSASATAAPVIQPTNLSYRLGYVVSPRGGRDVTLRWTAAPFSPKYLITGLGFTGAPSTIVTATSLLIPNVPRGTYRICVESIYPFDVQDAATRRCIDVTA